MLGLAGPIVVNRSHPDCPTAWYRATHISYGGARFFDLLGRESGLLKNFGFTPSSGWSPQVWPGGIGSIRFDGSNDEVAVARKFDIQKTTPFTIACWVKRLGTFGCTFGDGNLSTGGWQICSLSLAGDCLFGMQGNGSGTGHVVYTSTSVVPANVWTHICWTYDGSNTNAGFKLYINGVAQTLSTYGSDVDPGTLTSTEFVIGTRQDRAGVVDGYMDDIRVYMYRCLNSTQVRNIYTSSQQGDPGLLQRRSWFAWAASVVSNLMFLLWPSDD